MEFVGFDKLKIWVALSYHTKQIAYRLYKCAIRLTLCLKSEVI